MWTPVGGYYPYRADKDRRTVLGLVLPVYNLLKDSGGQFDRNSIQLELRNQRRILKVVKLWMITEACLLLEKDGLVTRVGEHRWAAKRASN